MSPPAPGSGSGRGTDGDRGFIEVRGEGAEARLRRDLEGIVAAALDAVDPARLVREALEGGVLEGLDPATASGPVGVLAVGKAAPGMARGALSALGERVGRGLVLAPRSVEADAPSLAPLRLLRGGHPLPDRAGVRGARAVLEAVRATKSGETLLLLLSGGGSALLTLPAGQVGLDELRTTTRQLLKAGVDVRALNAVRKHLERLKGGGLARAVDSGPLRAAVISDVVGDPLDVIASGPVSPDPTTFAEALEILDRAGGRDGVPEAVRRRLDAGAAGRIAETPGPGDPCFEGVEAAVVGSAGTAVAEAEEEARRRGYRTRSPGTEVTGEARQVGGGLGRRARAMRRGEAGPTPPGCLIAAGETTVTVTGDGRGGRNQEVALGAARSIDGLEGVLVASVGTDGVDGPTDAAGALVTGGTLERARRSGLDPNDALARNDADRFFRALGDRVVTGPTGTNVMDLQIVLVGR